MTTSLRQVNLLQDFQIMPTDPAIVPEGTRITAKDLSLPVCCRNHLASHSKFIPRIIDYVEKLRKGSNNGRMLLLQALENEDNEGQLDFNVSLPRRRVERFCELLPKPCLQITVRLRKDQSNQELTATFVKKFELLDILEDFKRLNEDTVWKRYDLFAAPSDMDRVAKLDIALGWVEPDRPKVPQIQMGVSSFMQTMYGRDSSKDLTIVAGNGAEIKCHSVIFEAHGDVLAAMISSKNGMLEGTSGTIKMTENSEEGLSLLIRYFYGMELTNDDLSSADVAVELFGTAHKYLLMDLQKCLGELLLQKGRNWYSPGALIELYFQVKNLDEWKSLQEHSLGIMLSMSEEIKSCDRFEELSRAEALALVWKLLEMEKQQKNPATTSPSQPRSKRRRIEN